MILNKNGGFKVPKIFSDLSLDDIDIMLSRQQVSNSDFIHLLCILCIYCMLNRSIVDIHHNEKFANILIEDLFVYKDNHFIFKFLLNDLRIHRVLVLTVVHNDINASIYEGVKDFN